MIVLIFLMIILAASLVATIFAINALFATIKTGLPFVSTPDWAVDWLRDHLPLDKNDVVYELGCGDARVLVAMAQQHPETKFVGIELQWWPYLLAQHRARHVKNVTIIH